GLEFRRVLFRSFPLRYKLSYEEVPLHAGDPGHDHTIVKALPTGGGYPDVVGGVALPAAVVYLLVEDRVRLPHAAGQVVPAHLLRRGGGPGRPLLLDGFGHLLHLRRRGAGADGVGENMYLREAAAPDEVQGPGKLLLRLPRETHDQVRGNCGAGKVYIQ